jgi:hypothetical protein
MKAYWGVEVQFHTFLTAALDVGEWSALPPEKGPLVPIVYEAGLGAVVRRKIPSPYRESNPHHPARNPELYHRTITVPALMIIICFFIAPTSIRQLRG